MKKEPARIGGTFLRRLAFVYSLWVYYVIGKNRDFDNIMVIQPQGFYSISFLPDELGAGGDDTWLGGEAPRRQLS